MVREKLACKRRVASYFNRKFEDLPKSVKELIHAECNRGVLAEWLIVLAAARLLLGKPSKPEVPEPTPDEWEQHLRRCLDAAGIDAPTPEELEIIWEGILSSPQWEPQKVVDELRRRLGPQPASP